MINNNKNDFLVIKSGVFQPRFGVYSRCQRQYPYIKGWNSGASQRILSEQVVMCLAHSKERFKTSFVEYWGWGWGWVQGRSLPLRAGGGWCTAYKFIHQWGPPEIVRSMQNSFHKLHTLKTYKYIRALFKTLHLKLLFSQLKTTVHRYQNFSLLDTSQCILDHPSHV